MLPEQTPQPNLNQGIRDLLKEHFSEEDIAFKNIRYIERKANSLVIEFNRLYEQDYEIHSQAILAALYQFVGFPLWSFFIDRHFNEQDKEDMFKRSVVHILPVEEKDQEEIVLPEMNESEALVLVSAFTLVDHDVNHDIITQFSVHVCRPEHKPMAYAVVFQRAISDSDGEDDGKDMLTGPVVSPRLSQVNPWLISMN